MKCKQHPCEQGVGVCASCLRERLLALIAVQNELAAAEHHRRRSDPPPLVFPRSVSPYVAHRRSAGSDAPAPHRNHIHRFFSTPQVGPAYDASADASGYIAGRRTGAGRFSLFSFLFHHPRSGEAKPGPGPSRASGAGSWLSALVGRRRRKKTRPFTGEPPGRACRPGDRGMSPARDDDSACSSGYATESSPAWWRKPTPTPMRRPAAARGGVSGFAVCLSPLVRASPGGGRRCGAPEVGASADLRVVPSPHHHHHRNASGGVPALAPNRSRKLTDFGRFK